MIEREIEKLSCLSAAYPEVPWSRDRVWEIYVSLFWPLPLSESLMGSGTLFSFGDPYFYPEEI